MSIKVNIHSSYLQHLANDQDIVEVNGRTVGECLDHLITLSPGIENKIFDKPGKVHDYFGIFVNGVALFPEGLAKPVEDGDEIHLVLALGGG